MHDGIRPLIGENGIHQRLVADVAVDEAVARVACHGLQVFEVARVGQLIEIDDADGRIFSQRKADEGRPDETGASGNEEFAHAHRLLVL
jgi:hypothetical protein